MLQSSAKLVERTGRSISLREYVSHVHSTRLNDARRTLRCCESKSTELTIPVERYLFYVKLAPQEYLVACDAGTYTTAKLKCYLFIEVS